MSLAGLTAGKHVYLEKTVALHIEEANQLVKTVDAMGVKFACAPVLGQVQQSAAKGVPVDVVRRCPAPTPVGQPLPWS